MAGHDPGEHRTIIHRRRSATLRSRVEPRNQRLDQRPQPSGTNRRDSTSVTEMIMTDQDQPT